MLRKPATRLLNDRNLLGPQWSSEQAEPEHMQSLREIAATFKQGTLSQMSCRFDELFVVERHQCLQRRVGSLAPDHAVLASGAFMISSEAGGAMRFQKVYKLRR